MAVRSRQKVRNLRYVPQTDPWSGVLWFLCVQVVSQAPQNFISSDCTRAGLYLPGATVPTAVRYPKFCGLFSVCNAINPIIDPTSTVLQWTVTALIRLQTHQQDSCKRRPVQRLSKLLGVQSVVTVAGFECVFQREREG